GGLRFDESHSHAPDQWIAKPEGGWPEGTMVLVDDELTTGATACNLIELLHEHSPRERYVVAALLDGRGKGAGKGPESPIKQTAKKLGVKIDVVALRKRGAEVRTEAGWSGGELPVQQHGLRRTDEVREVWLGFEGVLQHQGQDAAARQALADAAMDAAAEIGPMPRGTLVLGTGEHLAFAQRAAVYVSALTSSTTRSPVLVSDLEGYPIRDGLAFPNPDGADIAGFAYNVHAARRPAIVVHFQDAAHRERGQALLDALAAAGARDLTAVTLAP
ncbi:MAG: phosphoribosyltransferase domain-containing protein, partial [Solirubrobacteraceae bacterium]|nr:phosphoribosyltransferase domain-containing protein [Solirubrobacteraceae bacterium]